jgi:hypothetical protein
MPTFPRRRFGGRKPLPPAVRRRNRVSALLTDSDAAALAGWADAEDVAVSALAHRLIIAALRARERRR